MRYSLLFLFLAFSFISFGQKRIGVDVNTHLINLNYTIHFQEVIKGPLLYSAGVFFGGYGDGFNTNSRDAASNGFNLGIAYPTLNRTFTDTTGTYDLFSYSTRGKGIGAYIGFGLFHEFGTQHGIRFNLNNRFGWMKSKLFASYFKEGQDNARIQRPNIYHFTGAVSLELYHTIRLTGRHTFYWGFKLPYYYTLDKGRYNPVKDSELFHKFKFDVSIGMTRAIGKCN
jgi:hypothetical protein